METVHGGTVPRQKHKGFRKTRRMLAVEAAHGGADIQTLVKQRYNALEDWNLVATDLQVSRMTLWVWRTVLGLDCYKTVRS